MRRAQQDASAASLWLCVCETEGKDGVQREWKGDLSPSFLFLPEMHFIRRLCEGEGTCGAIWGQSYYVEADHSA